MSGLVRAEKYPPLERGRVALRLGGGAALITSVVSLVGLAIVNLSALSGLTSWEHEVNTWFVLQRTLSLDYWSEIGSFVAGTRPVIDILVVMMILLRLFLGRWRESWAMFAAVAGGSAIFLIASIAVGRLRPDVSRLDNAPPTSSFPSGHMGASVVLYGFLAIMIMRHLQVKWLALPLATLFWAVPIAVGLSRLYRGVHHPLDVLFGAIDSGIWLAIVVTTLLPRTVRRLNSATPMALPGKLPK